MQSIDAVFIEIVVVLQVGVGVGRCMFVRVLVGFAASEGDERGCGKQDVGEATGQRIYRSDEKDRKH